MKSAYKWVIGAVLGLGLLLSPIKLDYKDSQNHVRSHKPPVSGQISPRNDTQHQDIHDKKPLQNDDYKESLKKRFRDELKEYEEPYMKLAVLDKYLVGLEIMINLNFTGDVNRFKVLDYISALEEIIIEDPVLPDEYAPRLEEAKKFFIEGERNLGEATKKDKAVI